MPTVDVKSGSGCSTTARRSSAPRDKDFLGSIPTTCFSNLSFSITEIILLSTGSSRRCNSTDATLMGDICKVLRGVSTY